MSSRFVVPAVIAAFATNAAIESASAHPALAISNTPCATADSAGVSFRGELQAMIADTDSAAAAARDSIYHVPSVPANTMTFVTDSLVCQKVAAVFTSRRIDSTVAATTRVYVLDLNGVGYAAKDADDPSTVLILNPQLVVTGGYSGP